MDIYINMPQIYGICGIIIHINQYLMDYIWIIYQVYISYMVLYMDYIPYIWIFHGIVSGENIHGAIHSSVGYPKTVLYVAEEVRNFGGSKPHRFHRIQASKAWGK